MKSYKVVIEYDGSQFYGYQKQLSFYTVQGVLEKTLFFIFKKETKVRASGRTDRGVHALGQVISFSAETKRSKEKILETLQRKLPNSIRALSIEELPDFNARCAIERTYLYKILPKSEETSFNSNYYCFKDIDDLDKLNSILSKFKGAHNFKYFSTRLADHQSPNREIFDISIFKKGSLIEIEIKGACFLRGMIRLIMGTSFKIYDGCLNLSFIEEAFNNPNVKERKVRSSASGLYLKEIKY